MLLRAKDTVERQTWTETWTSPFPEEGCEVWSGWATDRARDRLRGEDESGGFPLAVQGGPAFTESARMSRTGPHAHRQNKPVPLQVW